MIKFLLVISILILGYIYFQEKLPFEFFTQTQSISSIPTVYIVWNDKFNVQGLGDKLRGTIAIYQYCQKNSIPCVFDSRFSTFGKFLTNGIPFNPHPLINKSTPVAQLLNVYDDPQALGNFISKQIDLALSSNQNYVCIETNLFTQIPLSLSDMDFLEWVMKPIPGLEQKINKIIQSLPPDYTIQHFRFKDKSEPDDTQCAKCFDLLTSSYQSTDILMSNSSKFKNWVKNKLSQIHMIEPEFDPANPSLHVGLNPSDDIIEFTLVEYSIIKKACGIRTYSEYNWISAFVYWPGQFYSIPIINTQILDLDSDINIY
jgi:hypothetical protein